MVFKSTNIFIHNVKINVMENGAIVSLTRTRQVRKANHYKESFGFGVQGGDGVTLLGETSMVNDPDMVDHNSIKENRPFTL
ncbi:hypothetical protein [Bacillus sp. B-jedd]|uniref:hypothetical protein n=1 Tax=Bacillus sp. B-jedd TaxID=1476857 RepID=UPI0005156BDE|nr:hypothetical protein [Bacillus sp. B-jedd]CEG28684.1 hypothetical protein BN1002_03607 [Bacillus sp. B-jedd]